MCIYEPQMQKTCAMEIKDVSDNISFEQFYGALTHSLTSVPAKFRNDPTVKGLSQCFPA